MVRLGRNKFYWDAGGFAFDCLVQPTGSSHPVIAGPQVNFQRISCTRFNKLLVRLIRGKSHRRKQHKDQEFPRGVRAGKKALLFFHCAGHRRNVVLDKEGIKDDEGKRADKRTRH
jgi:hypothetical protein